MSPAEVSRLMDVLDRIATGMTRQPYTLTGAADWPLLVFLFGLGMALVGVLFGIIVYNLKELKSCIKDGDSGTHALIAREELEREKQDNLLWAETRRMESASKEEHAGLKQDMIRCQEKCGAV